MPVINEQQTHKDQQPNPLSPDARKQTIAHFFCIVAVASQVLLQKPIFETGAQDEEKAKNDHRQERPERIEQQRHAHTGDQTAHVTGVPHPAVRPA